MRIEVFDYQVKTITCGDYPPLLFLRDHEKCRKADYAFILDIKCRSITILKNRNLDHNILRYIINNIVERYSYLNEVMRYCDGFLFEDFKNYFVDQIDREIQRYTPTIKNNENFIIRSL